MLDALRYNGQVLGREFPIIIGDGEFRARLICPEADSLHPDYHSDYVKVCLQRLTDAKVLAPKVKVLGQDLNSEQTVSYEEAGQSSWQNPIYDLYSFLFAIALWRHIQTDSFVPQSADIEW